MYLFAAAAARRAHFTGIWRDFKTMATVKYINQKLAAQVDNVLMGEEVGYTLEQLMELAGLSVAQSVYDAYLKNKSTRSPDQAILVCCGPGNNGGDGLVAARHLHEFGYPIQVFYPVVGKHPFYKHLLKQLEAYQIPFIKDIPEDFSQYGIVLDAIFGFGFKGTIREPFAQLIQDLRANSKLFSLVSVDVPSGWDVDEGNKTGEGLQPDCLISLTLPKLCAKEFTGKHYLGGRFVPSFVSNQFGLKIPAYPGSYGFFKLH